MKRVVALLLFVVLLTAQAPTRYDFVLRRVVDGDTLEVLVDIGFDTYRLVKTRLYGIDTPEKYGVKKWADAAHTTYTPEYALGQAATDYTTKWLTDHCTERDCQVDSRGTGKYGRWLVVVYDAEGQTLNDALVESGNAVRKEY